VAIDARLLRGCYTAVTYVGDAWRARSEDRQMLYAPTLPVATHAIAEPAAPLRLLVAARSETFGRRIANRLGQLGHEAIGPLSPEAALAAERATRPDLCLLELPVAHAGGVVLLTPSVADRRIARGQSVRLAGPFDDEALAAAIRLAFERAADLRTIERESVDPNAALADLDALVRAKAVLGQRLGMSERHAARRLRAAADRRGERLADTARRVWERRGCLTALDGG
jgi:response regulator NasT